MSRLRFASNPFFCERSTHIEIESVLQVTVLQVFTKSMRGSRISYLCSKINPFHLYAPTFISSVYILLLYSSLALPFRVITVTNLF